MYVCRCGDAGLKMCKYSYTLVFLRVCVATEYLDIPIIVHVV